jgi:glycosyltransferase involved in cell wall biosynthesis
MRVLLALGWYFPDSLGGTEVYVNGLARQLQTSGVDVSIAAPRECRSLEEYSHDGIRVWRYPDSASNGSNGHGLDEWRCILDKVQPDVVDIHSLTTGLGLDHLCAAKRHRTATVLTVHVPLICQRGTLLRFGQTPCDGDLRTQPCVECRLQSRGVPRPIASLAARVPSAVRRRAGAARLPRAVRALVEAEDRAAEHRQRLQHAFDTADRVVAVSRWLGEMLVRNGLAPEKLAICPQGVDRPHRRANAVGSERLRVGFVGRYDVVKGLHVLVDAIRRMPAHVPVECRIWGTANSLEGASYLRRVRRLAGADPRVHFDGTGAPDVFAAVDVLVVPSIWLETGPLVLLEAFAAGVPVIGSNLGGIAEKIRHGVDGWLVTPGDARELADVLMAFASNRALLDSLRARIPVVRTTEEVAADTLNVYRAVLN